MIKETKRFNKVSQILFGACTLMFPAAVVQGQTEFPLHQMSTSIETNSSSLNSDTFPLEASKILVQDDAMARKIAISFHHAILEMNYEQNYIIADLTAKEISQLKTFGLEIVEATDWNFRYLQFRKDVELSLKQKAEGIRMTGISGF